MINCVIKKIFNFIYIYTYKYAKNVCLFLVKWALCRGPEQRESEKTVLYLQIIIILNNIKYESIVVQK
jgi:hypothetical protein